MQDTPYYGSYPIDISDSPQVFKSWHRPPGLSADFRGWAVIVDGREVSLHETATDAYNSRADLRAGAFRA